MTFWDACFRAYRTLFFFASLNIYSYGLYKPLAAVENRQFFSILMKQVLRNIYGVFSRAEGLNRNRIRIILHMS